MENQRFPITFCIEQLIEANISQKIPIEKKIDAMNVFYLYVDKQQIFDQTNYRTEVQ